MVRSPSTPMLASHFDLLHTAAAGGGSGPLLRGPQGPVIAAGRPHRAVMAAMVRLLVTNQHARSAPAKRLESVKAPADAAVRPRGPVPFGPPW
jgi:hypothetical protein